MNSYIKVMSLVLVVMVCTPIYSLATDDCPECCEPNDPSLANQGGPKCVCTPQPCNTPGLPAGSTGRSDDSSSSGSGMGNPWQQDVKTTVTPMYSYTKASWVNNFSKDIHEQNNDCGEGFYDTRPTGGFNVTLSANFSTPSYYGFSIGVTLFEHTFSWGQEQNPYSLDANPCKEYCVASWIIAARGCISDTLDTVEQVTVTEFGQTTTYNQNPNHQEHAECTDEGEKKVVWANNEGKCCPNDCS